MTINFKQIIDNLLQVIFIQCNTKNVINYKQARIIVIKVKENNFLNLKIILKDKIEIRRNNI